jgi:hypothetical protein
VAGLPYGVRENAKVRRAHLLPAGAAPSIVGNPGQGDVRRALITGRVPTIDAADYLSCSLDAPPRGSRGSVGTGPGGLWLNCAR